MIYAACEGRVSDIKALESSSYWDFCTVLNNYLEKVEKHNQEMERLSRENNIGSSKVKSRPASKKSSIRKK